MSMPHSCRCAICQREMGWPAMSDSSRIADVMRRSDPEYVESHAVLPTSDEEWDAVIEDVENYLEEHERLYNAMEGEK